MDHPADLQLKECWLAASGRDPVLLVKGGKAQGAGVAVLEGPPSSHGRKVWRFRFTYTVPEGGHIPFSAILKCRAGLQVSVTPSPSCDAIMLVPISGSSLVGLSHTVGGWSPSRSSIPWSAKSLGVPTSAILQGCTSSHSHPNLPLHRMTPSLRRSWR